MGWTDGLDRAANYIVTNVNWNDLLGAAGSLMQLKSHAHGGATGEGSQAIGPLTTEDFTDAAAAAAPGAGKTRLYAVSGRPRFRAGAAGSDLELFGMVGSDADGDMYYRAASALARLAKGTANQTLRMNGGATAPTWVTAGGITTLDKDVSTTTIVSSVAETDLYRYTTLANTIGATGGLRLEVSGDGLSNGGSSTLTLRVKFGATTLFTSSAMLMGNSASRYKWALFIEMLQSATNAQRFTARLEVGAAAGTMDSVLAFNGIDYNTSAEDTTANKDIAVTGQLGTSSGTIDVRQQMALLDQIA